MSKKFILAVDDNPNNLSVISQALRSVGWQVRVAVDGEDALVKVAQNPPELILLDVMMPGISGFEVCQRLKLDETTADIPIIFMTAIADTMSKVKGLSIGAVDYITKPFEQEEVIARVRIHLQLRELTQTLEKQLLYQEKLYRQTQAQAEREQALNRVLRSLRSSLDLQIVFSTAAAEIARLLQVERVVIIQYLPQQEIWRNVMEYQMKSNSSTALGFGIADLANPITARLKQREIVKLETLESTLDQAIATSSKTFPDGSLLIPLQIGTEVWGVVGLVRSAVQAPWQASEIELATAIADQLAIAIQQSELYQQLQAANQQLQQLAMSDGLTQIANRRYFDESIAQEWHRSARERQMLSLVLCDVDYFKNYNDACGHLAGDNCLVQVAKAISRAVKRSADLVTRYGGEEFAIILPNTDSVGAVQVAQSIQLELQHRQIVHPASNVSPYVTLSIGIASTIPRSDTDYPSLIAIADQALYQAKMQGRDRYHVHLSG